MPLIYPITLRRNIYLLIFLNIFLCIYFGTYVCTVHIVHIYTKYICRTRVVAGHIYVDISHNTEDEYIFVDTSTSDLGGEKY